MSIRSPYVRGQMSGQVPFKWDGSDVGAIDVYITTWEYVDPFTVLFFVDGSRAVAHAYKDAVPLIADELKPLFGLTKLGRHRCTIGARPALITRLIAAENSLPKEGKGVVTPDLIPSVRRAYVFRWALGLLRNSDTALWFRTYTSGVSSITSFREDKFDYTRTSSQGATLTQTVVKRWFDNDWDNVNASMRAQFTHEQLVQLRLTIADVIKRLDPKLVTWTQHILRRIQDRL